MKRKSSFSRILALVLTLALVLGALTISASAADVTYTMTKTSRTLTNSGGTTIATISVSSSDLTTTGVSNATWTGNGTANIFVDLVPAATGATGTLNFSITPSGGTAQTGSVAVSGGAGQTTTTSIGGVIYTVIVQSTEEAYPTIDYGGNYVGAVSGENVSLAPTGGTGTASDPFTFKATAPVTGYPFTMSLRIIPDGDDFNDLTSYSYTVLDASDATLDNFVGTYFLAGYSADGTVLRFSITTSATVYYAVTLKAAEQSDGDGIYAFLPAPGQFTNEGVNTGGWGDAYVSGSSALKGIVENMSTTGVSLGYFGGYVVLDMATKVDENGKLKCVPVDNDADNLYGIDFIVYGNAFNHNSEPGCIQVAQGKVIKDPNDNTKILEIVPDDMNNDGVVWYDIAGSLHYNSSTVWDADYTFKNPATSDDSITTFPTTGTISTGGVPFTYTGSDVTGTGNGTVTYNTFHRHSWFPININYFEDVTVNSNSRSAMDKAGALPFVRHELPSATNSLTQTELELTGVKLGSATNTQTANYRFGYADVHPKYNVTGYESSPYNPYAFADSNLSNWNSYMGSASNTAPAGGGDPIDISWAVYPSGTMIGGVDVSGQPVYLEDICFVRIYTGAAYINGIFGEISTEVCGVYKATGTGSGDAQTGIPTVKDYNNNNAPVATTNLGTQTVTTTTGVIDYDVYSNADHVYVNGTAVSCSATTPYSIGLSLASGETKYIQIITQSGTESPYITLFKFVRP